MARPNDDATAGAPETPRTPVTLFGEPDVNIVGEDPRNVERLHPALRDYVMEIPLLGLCLKHPLVFQCPFVSWKLANRVLEQNGRKLEEAIAAGQWDHAIWYYERPYRMFMLAEWWEDERITRAQLRSILGSCWMDTENEPEHRESSLALFKAAGFITDSRNKLKGRLTIYHGIERADDEPGIAWSLSIDTARWFARRFRTDTILLRATVDASDILAYLTSRREEEIVVDPNILGDIEVIE